MSFVQRIRRNKEQWTINGVAVHYKPNSKGVSKSEWREVIEDLFDEFQTVGWLQGFQSLHIGKGAARGDAIGWYDLRGNIYLENEPYIDDRPDILLETGPRAALIHEMIHYVHLSLSDYNGSPRKRITSESERNLLKRNVSLYAVKSVCEAVAEIGTGIILGHDFPEKIHSLYERYDGPQEVYDIGKEIR